MRIVGISTASKALGKYIAETKYDALPPDVISEAKKRIADVIGIGLSGSGTQVRRIEKFCTAHGKQGSSTIWGIGTKTSPEYAALANGTMTFHLELDDVHRTSHTHPGVSSVPAALAICEQNRLSGKALVEAVVVGYDASIRIGLAVSPSIYVDRTYLAPGTLAIFGSAASAAKLAGQDAETAGKTIAAAAYYGPLACYEPFRLGAGIKDMIMGWANLSGMYAAEFASFGFEGPDTAIEGDFGFCRTTSAKFDIARLYDRLGTYHEILFTGIKPYACCRQHHAAIDCMLELRENHPFGLDDVEHVKVRTFVVSSRGNQKRPTSIPEAKYSIPYILAVALKYGKVWREQFTEELIADETLLSFAERVDVEPDHELDKLYDEKWPSIVEVKLKNGTVFSVRRDLPKGEPEFPCTDEDIREKFMSLSSDVLTSEKASRLWEFLNNIEDIEDLGIISELLRSDR